MSDNTSSTNTNQAGSLSVWSNLLNVGGNLGLTALQNRGSQIKGQYAVELQALQNDAAMTQAQKDQALLKLNTEYAKATGDVKAQQTKLYIQAAALVLLVGGALTVAILLIVRKK
nr:hypothetical protein [uncultured Arsenicibacter sp.]